MADEIVVMHSSTRFLVPSRNGLGLVTAQNAPARHSSLVRPASLSATRRRRDPVADPYHFAKEQQNKILSYEAKSICLRESSLEGWGIFSQGPLD